MHHRRTTRVLALLATVALFATACGGDDEGGETDTPSETSTATDGGTASGGGDDLAAIKESGTLRVGTKFDQPLFGVNAPGGVVGFDAEIAKLIAEAIFEDGDPASHIEFKEAVSANREPFLQNDQVDIVVATYTINDERDQVVDFAGPYYVAGQDIMVPSGNPNGIESVDDLNTAGPDDLLGRRLDLDRQLQRGCARRRDHHLRHVLQVRRGDERRPGGRGTTDNVILIGLISESDGEYELVDNPFTEEPYGIGVPEGSDMRCFINGVLQDIYDSGEWAKAYESTVGTAGSATPEPPALNNEGC